MTGPIGSVPSDEEEAPSDCSHFANKPRAALDRRVSVAVRDIVGDVNGNHCTIIHWKGNLVGPRGRHEVVMLVWTAVVLVLVA